MFWSICDGKGNKAVCHREYGAVPCQLYAAASERGPGDGQPAQPRAKALTPATWGLVLAGSQIGVAVSLVVLNVTHN